GERAAPRPPPAGPYAGPADQPAERVLDAAVTAAAALVVNQYRKAYPAAEPQPGPGRHPGLVGRVEATVASSPRLKRTVRELSSRFPPVRRPRILAWRAPSPPPARPRRPRGTALAGAAATGPAVAAVVVTCNRRQLLLEALEAVHAQSRAPDAVIVVDNASADGTAAAVRRHYPSVRLAELTRN